jgi:hypothetical protein
MSLVFTPDKSTGATNYSCHGFSHEADLDVKIWKHFVAFKVPDDIRGNKLFEKINDIWMQKE